MEQLISFFLLIIIFGSVVAMIITSYIVSNRKLWIPLLFAAIASFGIGFGLAEGNFIFGLTVTLILIASFAFIFILSIRVTKYFRDNALKKLAHVDRDLTMDDLFGTKNEVL